MPVWTAYSSSSSRAMPAFTESSGSSRDNFAVFDAALDQARGIPAAVVVARGVEVVDTLVDARCTSRLTNLLTWPLLLHQGTSSLGAAASSMRGSQDDSVGRGRCLHRAFQISRGSRGQRFSRGIFLNSGNSGQSCPQFEKARTNFPTSRLLAVILSLQGTYMISRGNHGLLQAILG